MLIDDAMQFLRLNPMGSLFSPSAIKQLTDSTKYVLSPEIVQTVTQYEHDKPQNLLKGIAFARPPHRLTWIEFPVVPRIHALRELESDIDPQQPARIGYLIESLNSKHTHYRVQYVWDTPKAYEGQEGYDPITVTIVAAEYNIEPIDTPIDPDDFAGFSQLIKTSSGLFKNYRDRTDQHESIYKLVDHHQVIPSPWIPPSRYEAVIQAIEQNFDDLNKDLASELLFLPCALLLLNAKNAVTLAPSDMERLNKQREKSGKSRLSDYQTVKFHLSRRNSQKSQNESTVNQTKKLHICCGHFKFRKTANNEVKPFWWTEHQRGTPTGQTAKKTRIVVP
jgi:hypothetical protein